MKLIESLIWGMIAAFTALVLEVAIDVMFEIFVPQANFNFLYTESTNSLVLVIVTIFIVATIEESLKFTIFLKRISTYVTEKNLVLHGALLGFGFFLTEIFLASQNYDLLLTIPIWSIIIVILTHTLLGSLLLYSIIKISKSYQIILLIFIITLHASVNIAILSFLS